MRKMIVLLLAFLVQGCATDYLKYTVNINSISAPNIENKKRYALLPADETLSEGSLQYQEYTNYIDIALQQKGFIKEQNFETADIAIFIKYDISDPETTTSNYSIPTYGETGIASASSYGTFDALGNYSQRTTYTPTYGVTGSRTYQETTTTYHRYLVLNAVDLDEYRKTEKLKQVWNTKIQSSGSDGDLRTIFPFLLTAAKPYLGSNTGKTIEVDIFKNDERVKELTAPNAPQGS